MVCITLHMTDVVVADMKWLGLHSTDIINLPANCRQPLSKKGKKELLALSSQDSLQPGHQAELLKMLELKIKVELGK